MSYLKRTLCITALLLLGLTAASCTGKDSPEDTLPSTEPTTTAATDSVDTEEPTQTDDIHETEALTQPETEPETAAETVVASIATDKVVYEVDEDIVLTVMANPGDTVGFYPAAFDTATQKPIYYGTFSGEDALEVGVPVRVTELPGTHRRETEVAFYYGVLPVGDYKAVITSSDGVVIAEAKVRIEWSKDTITTGAELAAKCLDVALNYKTLYVNGCFGAPMTDTNKQRYTQNTAYNRQPERQALIHAATADTFGFDCVCFIKGLMWGWDGDLDHVYGGAAYQSNGVADITENAMLESCDDISRDWKAIEVGEVVWLDGHIGVYIGNGLAVECTPAWEDCVQITACNNSRRGYNTRSWSKHGKLPYLTYTGEYESVRD